MLGHILKTSVILLVSVSFTSFIFGQDVPSLRELERSAPPIIKGAKVSTADEARQIALNAYMGKTKAGLLANESPGSISVIKLGFELPEYGKDGDKVWEVRFTKMLPDGNRALRAILWVHSETAKVYFLIGPWQDKPIKD